MLSLNRFDCRRAAAGETSELIALCGSRRRQYFIRVSRFFSVFSVFYDKFLNLILQQAVDVIFPEFVAAVQEGEFDDKGYSNDLRTHLLR